MVRLALHSIAYEAKTLNLAKEGYTAYYVDGTNGLDIHDGGSWSQAFKTIQHAVDEAGSWCKIFIKEGTYAENVVIDKDHIHLIGNDKGTTIITPTTGYVLVVTSNDCTIEELYGKAVELAATCFSIGGNNNVIHDCKVYGSNIGLSLGVALVGDNCKAYNISNVADTYMGVYSDGEYNEIYDCLFDAAYTGVQIAGDKCRIHDNEIRNCKVGGTAIDINGDNNSIYHNNLVSNDKYVSDAGAGNKWFENYYSDHVTDTDNDGMADSSRTEDGATDYQPVSRRNGWNQESICNVSAASAANQATIIADIGRNVSMMEFWGDVDDIITLTTATIDINLPNIVVADIPAGATIIRVVGMIRMRAMNNTNAATNAINGANAIKVKKSTGAWATDDVDLINIVDNVWSTAASTKEGGMLIEGDNDAATEVDENATYNLRFNGNIFVDGNNLELIDVDVGLKVYFVA